MNDQKYVFYAVVGVIVASMLACGSASKSIPGSHDTPLPGIAVDQVDRAAKIPAGAVKISPETDAHPPLLHSNDFEQPIPVPGEINTAGAEDSPFITSDGGTLYFFFTPDVNIPVEKQILDGVTGIYASNNLDGKWSGPERIILQEPGKLAMDGCEFVSGSIMWFCTIREGYAGIHWFTAEYANGGWQNWRAADFNPDYMVGELHFTGDDTELYFHSDRPGGNGQLDIWISRKFNGDWQEPINVSAVNTADSEGWPAVSPDGNELWFTRNYGIWRSNKVNGEWQPAEQVISSFAGEPSIDAAGNLYFVHHFFEGERMLEADLYVAYRK